MADAINAHKKLAMGKDPQKLKCGGKIKKSPKPMKKGGKC